jgi:hypothetical protein
MGVIKRFAIWSMVLGALAIAGGASALAFDGTNAATGTPASAPVEAAPVATEPTVVDETPVDETPLVSDVPSDAAADAKAALMRWTSSHAIAAE